MSKCLGVTVTLSGFILIARGIVSAFINPLVPDPLYLVCMAKISILKKEGIIEKKFHTSVVPMSR